MFMTYYATEILLMNCCMHCGILLIVQCLIAVTINQRGAGFTMEVLGVVMHCHCLKTGYRFFSVICKLLGQLCRFIHNKPSGFNDTNESTRQVFIRHK